MGIKANANDAGNSRWVEYTELFGRSAFKPLGLSDFAEFGEGF
jgi:hypothetical protein